MILSADKKQLNFFKLKPPRTHYTSGALQVKIINSPRQHSLTQLCTWADKPNNYNPICRGAKRCELQPTALTTSAGPVFCVTEPGSVRRDLRGGCIRILCSPFSVMRGCFESHTSPPLFN